MDESSVQRKCYTKKSQLGWRTRKKRLPPLYSPNCRLTITAQAATADTYSSVASHGPLVDEQLHYPTLNELRENRCPQCIPVNCGQNNVVVRS